jgi:hypothetical protein
MRWGWLGPGLMLAAVSVAPASAAPLTCRVFKDRLNGALLAGAGAEAGAVVFKPGYTDPERGTRYDWTDSKLDGTMNCGPADEFQEFGISLEFRSKDSFADMLKHFMTVQGASICALASDGAAACEDAARTMLQEALAKMGQAYRRGSKSPSGLADRTILPGVSAEVTSASTLLTFLVGPGRGESLDAARTPLQHQPGKPAE